MCQPTIRLYQSALTTQVLSSSMAQEEALSSIVQLDFQRILTRVRSKHAQTSLKTKRRSNLIVLLKRTVEEPELKQRISAHPGVIDHLAVLVQASSLLDSEDSATHNGKVTPAAKDAMATMVMRAYFISKDRNLDILFQNLPPSYNPSRRNFLPRDIKKLGRYYEISQGLVRSALGNLKTLSRRISIQALPVERPPMQTLQAVVGSFEATADRVCRGALPSKANRANIASQKWPDQYRNLQRQVCLVEGSC